MASVVDTSVKFILADMPGAPVVSGVAGTLIAALDAFLVTGFGTKAVDSAAVTGGVCRLSFSSGASFADKNAVMQVTGLSNPALNGEQKITNFSTSWVEFATTVADGPVTGTASFKAAPLGWEKVFSGTNVAVYRPTDPASTRPYLRIDDTDAMSARGTMYETMTDANTGFNPMPAANVVNGGYYWLKRTSAGATGVQYLLLGDSRGVYVATMPNQPAGAMANQGANPCYAGDMISYRSGDAYCATLTGGITEDLGNNRQSGNVFNAEDNGCRTVMRRANGVGSAQTCDRTAYGPVNSGNDGPFGAITAPVNNGLFTAPIILSDGGLLTTNGPRGFLPGAMCLLHTGAPGALGFGFGQITGAYGYQGRTLMRCHITATPGNPNAGPGTGLFDITGPWREG